jgi:arylsulfatase A-like enzyme
LGTTNYIGAAQPSNFKDSWNWNRNLPFIPAPYVDKLVLEEKTIAEALKENGYATHFAGKWHLGHKKSHWPENQGFDVNIGGCGSGGPYGRGKYFAPYPIPNLKANTKGEHLPYRLTEETIKFIESTDKPFLAYMSFYSVHNPQITTHALKEKYTKKAARLKLTDHYKQEKGRLTQPASGISQVQSRPVYAGMIESMDDCVGKLLKCLKDTGKDKNTVVIFTSDNGGLSSSEGKPTSNLPLRGGKGWAYEGGVRVPTLIYWPGVTKPMLTDVPVISPDFYPTILAMAGLEAMPEQHVDGKDLTGLLTTGKMKERPLYWHYPHWGNQGGSPYSAVRLGKWKYISYCDGRTELFNLSDDVGEHKDLMLSYPEKALILKKKLNDWLKETKAKMPTKASKESK